MVAFQAQTCAHIQSELCKSKNPVNFQWQRSLVSRNQEVTSFLYYWEKLFCSGNFAQTQTCTCVFRRRLMWKNSWFSGLLHVVW